MKKILVVDDDSSIRTLLSINLTAEGYDVATVENGVEALLYLETNTVSLVILDIMMPEKDGWEVCKAIRDNEGEFHLKILMLTARDTPRDKIIGKALLGADEYVTKPFDITEIIQLVGRMTGDS